MDTFAKPARMSPEMNRLLDSLRSDGKPYPVYQQPPETADEQVCAVGQSLVTDANLQFAKRNQYMWFVRELARLFRTRYGRDLAFHLEMVLRKWQDLGLSPNIMQIIVCEVHNTLKPAEPIIPGNGGGERREVNSEKRTTAKHARSAKRSGRKSEGQSPKDESSPKREGPIEDRTPEIDASAGGLL